MTLGVELMERGWLPDGVTRWGIRRLLAERLRTRDAKNPERNRAALQAWIDELDRSPVAPLPAATNQQHYEVPTAFFEAVLGPHRKYSSCYWPAGVSTLEQAEIAMLELTAARAGLTNGQQVLDLGCGWGSFTLWGAARYPDSQFTAVSNSRTQRAFIERTAEQRGLSNVTVITADINDFTPGEHVGGVEFDRIVSVEMFEHVRNYRELLRRIATWLSPRGRLFVHLFCHREFAYPFEDAGQDDQAWMSRYFFTGGQMPSADLLKHFQHDLELEQHWQVCGRDYARTLRAWLDRMDAQRAQLWPLFVETYGARDAGRWWQRWRVFFIACEELFAYRGGNEWWVSHYTFAPRGRAAVETPRSVGACAAGEAV